MKLSPLNTELNVNDKYKQLLQINFLLDKYSPGEINLSKDLKENYLKNISNFITDLESEKYMDFDGEVQDLYISSNLKGVEYSYREFGIVIMGGMSYSHKDTYTSFGNIIEPSIDFERSNEKKITHVGTTLTSSTWKEQIKNVSSKIETYLKESF